MATSKLTPFDGKLDDEQPASTLTPFTGQLDGEKPRTRGLFEAVNDNVIEFANAAAGGVSALANFVKPGNAVSGFIDENIIKAGEQKQSDVVQGAKRQLSEGLQNAQGIGDEVGAVGRYVLDNPLLAASQAAGSFALPGGAVKGAGSAAKALGAGAKGVETAGRVGGIAAGAAMAGGDAAGTAYDLASKAGATEDQALAAGRQASVIPALVGGVTGAFGAERLLAGAKGFGGNALSRGLKSGLSEAGQEAVEEGVTQFEGQRAAMPYDATIDPTKGVAGAAAMGGIMGFGPGAVLGAIGEGPKPSQQMGIDPNAGPLSRAAASAVDSQPVPQPLGASITGTAPADLMGRATDPLAAQIASGRQKSEDLAVTRNAFADRNSEALAGGGLFGSRADPLANMIADQRSSEASTAANIDRAAQNRAPMTATEAGNMLVAAREQGQDFTVAPHPDGGFVVVPREWVMPQVAAKAEASLMETLGRVAQVEDAPINRAARVSTEPANLNLNTDPVTGYIDTLRSVNTPAARMFVSEFDAGRITRRDVERRMAAERGKTADERIAEAAAQAKKPEDPYSLGNIAQSRPEQAPEPLIEIPRTNKLKEARDARRAADELRGATGASTVTGGDITPPGVESPVADVRSGGRNNDAGTAQPDANGDAGGGVGSTAQGSAALRPDNWRGNAIKAGKVARSLGLDPNGKRLKEIVAEIDAVDAGTLPATPVADQPQQQSTLSNVVSLTDRLRDKVRDAAMEKATRQEIESQLAELSALGQQNRVTIGDLSRLQEITSNNTNGYNASRDLHQLLKVIRTRAAGNIQTETPANVKNAPQAANDGQAQASPVEARAPEGGNAASDTGVPAAGGNAGIRADGVKETWSLTREQYFNDPARVRREAVGPAIGGWKASYEYTEPSGAGPFKGNTVLKVKPKAGDIINAPFGKARITTVSAVKGTGIDNAELLDIGKAHHKRVVADAIASGKPVPDDVLAEYPDLSKNPRELNTSAEPVQKTSKNEQVAQADGVKEESKKRFSLEAGKPAYLDRAQKLVRDHLDGKINQEETIRGFLDLGMTVGQVRSVATPLDWWTVNVQNEYEQRASQPKQEAKKDAAPAAQAEKPAEQVNPEPSKAAQPKAEKPAEDDAFMGVKKDEPRNLVAMHNLTADNLLYADSIGGIPVPSIGITKIDSPFNGFGDVTLIAPSSMVDPEQGTPVFDRDAWTARFPTMNFKKVKAKVADAFYERMKPVDGMGNDGGQFLSMLWEETRNASVQRPDKVADLFRRYNAPKMLYAKEMLGKEIKVPMRAAQLSSPAAEDKQLQAYWKKNGNRLIALDREMSGFDFSNSPEYKAFMAEIEGAVRRYAIANDKEDRADRYVEMFLPDGQLGPGGFNRIRKDFEQVGTKEVDGLKLSEAVRKAVPDNDQAYDRWVKSLVEPLFEDPTITVRGREVDPTLENIVDAMTVGATAGAEKSLTFGPGKTAAMLGKRFKSMAEIKADRDRVVSQDQENEGKKATKAILDQYRAKATAFFKGTDWRGNIDTWAANDASMEALAKAGKAGGSNADIRQALVRAGFKQVDQTTVDLASESIKALRTAATDYFEAKPQRAVKLSEFRAAVVPKGVSQEVKDVLTKNGIEVVEYNKKTEGARDAAIQKTAKRVDKAAKDILFMGDKAKAQRQGTPVDRAIMDMAGEGREANEILSFIAKSSKSPYRRQLAQKLLATGANPAVSLGGEMGGGAGFRFLAKYSRKNHEVTLSEAAADRAEQIFLHETTHAATLLALDKGGLIATQMRRLAASVYKDASPEMRKMYGLVLDKRTGEVNVGEFVAEAFTNPEFQKQLKGIPVLGRSAWQRFVAMVRRIIGMDVKETDALTEALELGAKVMRENVALRKAQSFRAEDGPAYLGAWHGSPHRFDKFTTDKMGSGEGAQAYGWGLYFTSKKEIAEHYRLSLAKRETAMVKGKPLENQSGYLAAQIRNIAAFMARGKTFDQAKAQSLEDLRYRADPDAKSAADELERLGEKDVSAVRGQLYKVEIPEDTEMLLWDKPLSEQPEGVRKALEDYFDASEKGESIYNRIAENEGGQQSASEYLLSLDIRGIKYLDGSSRNSPTYSLDELKADLAKAEAAQKDPPKYGAERFLEMNAGVIADLKKQIANFKAPAYNYVVFSGDDVSIEDTEYFGIADAVEQIGKQAAVKPVVQALNDTFKVRGKIHWWHKTVGTPFNLAERVPEFKRVFNSVQDFINSVSFYGAEAAAMAPKIIPKLESWKDLGKSPIKAEDNKAIATPIFEGTLAWMRDESGRPVKVADMQAAADKLSPDEKAQRLLRTRKISPEVLAMWRGLPLEQFQSNIETRYTSEMLRPGVVWKDSELRSLFKLTDEQIGLYREFRAATDKSLTDLAISDILQFAGKDADPIKDQVMGMNLTEGSETVRDYLLSLADSDPDRRSDLIDTANAVIDKANRVQDLMDSGYAPLQRFGRFTVYAKDENGEQLFFGMYEDRWAAARAARQMREQYPGAKVETGMMSEEAYKMFQGISPETLEIFGTMLGMDSQADGETNKAFQTYLKLAKSNRSALKRLIERKGISGYSEDASRVLASFIYSNARQTASNLHVGEIMNGVNDIPRDMGEAKDAAVRLARYTMDPQEEAQALRGLLFAQYLGGSIASAAINALQPAQVTFPYLSQFVGAKKSASLMTGAVRDAIKKSTGDPRLDAELKKAEEEGIVSPQEIFQLMAQAQGKATLKAGDGTKAGDAMAAASNTLSRLSLGWGKVFSIPEQFNRRTTFIAAYRTAKETGEANPYEFAKQAVKETQLVYNKGNRPEWARGTIGALAFTFKTYSISYVELLQRMAASGPEGRRAALLMVGVLFVMAGAGGLPGVEDAEDVVDGIAQRVFGLNFQTRQKRQEWLADTFGEGGARFIENGLSGLPWSPTDVSGRLGLGNLIPGTGLFVKKENYGRDVAEIAGPAADMTKRFLEGAGLLLQGEFLKAGEIVSPTAVRNMIQGGRMLATDQYTDTKGRKVIDTTPAEGITKMIGFQPADVARVQEATGTTQRMIALNKIRESEIADKWAKGLASGDADVVQEARDELRKWNESNPESPIRINMPQLFRRVRALKEDKATRIARTAPKEIRQDVRRALEQGQ